MKLLALAGSEDWNNRSQIENQVLQSNPLLEALGNAKYGIELFFTSMCLFMVLTILFSGRCVMTILHVSANSSRCSSLYKDGPDRSLLWAVLLGHEFTLTFSRQFEFATNWREKEIIIHFISSAARQQQLVKAVYTSSQLFLLTRYDPFRIPK